jgi:hypothetical protein
VSFVQQRQQQHYQQLTKGSTILKTFTFPENLDLFKLTYSIFWINFSKNICGEGQMQAQACLANRRACSFRFQSRLHHDVQEAIAGKNSRSNKYSTTTGHKPPMLTTHPPTSIVRKNNKKGS